MNIYPQIVDHAIKYIDKYIKKSHHVLEFGSGMSTVYFAQRAKHVVTVENNKLWENRVKRMLFIHELNNVQHILVEDYDNLNITGEFDIIMIDGRERIKCLKYSLSMLKGILIFDDCDRPRYREGLIRYLSNYECVKYDNGQERKGTAIYARRLDT